MTETQTGVRSTRWLWIAAIWFAGGVFDASQNVLIMHKEGRHHSWLPLFLTELALWLPWAPCERPADISPPSLSSRRDGGMVGSAPSDV